MRYRGKATIDLSHDTSAEGRAFVDALIDSEPNSLDEAFRQGLYGHTEGHPLFASELIRSLRERGDLIQDQAGVWSARPGIDWPALPGRVEGVIAERIARLDAADQGLLKAASVEGDTFTAEVIARVLGEESRQVVARLSANSVQEHGLLSGAGLRRVGSQRMSSYAFRHHLFREYLYGMMDDAERSYIHEDVAHALQELYGEEDNEIIGQLALH
jgi:predicted ATPase